MKRKIQFNSLILLGFSLLTITACAELNGPTQKLQVGSLKFCVPKNEEISILDQTKVTAREVTGSDNVSYGSLQIILSPKIVTKEFQSYHGNDSGLPANLVLNFRTLSSGELKETLSGKSQEEVLLLQEEYANAHVTFVPEYGAYRVSISDAAPPYIIWHLINRKPGNENESTPRNLNDYYLSYCSRAGGIDGLSSNCQTYHDFNGLLLTITTSEVNTLEPNTLFSMASHYINNWNAKCNADGKQSPE